MIHLDGNYANNALCNLERVVAKPKDRKADKYRQGRENIHTAWTNMLRRCGYNQYVEFIGWDDKTKHYEGTQVYEEWKIYENFEKWYKENFSYNEYKIALDKDLFAKDGVKLYSPDTCCFLPCSINSRLACLESHKDDNYTHCIAKNGKWKTTYHTDDINGKRTHHSKMFDTYDELCKYRRDLEVDKFIEQVKKYDGILPQRTLDRLYQVAEEYRIK